MTSKEEVIKSRVSALRNQLHEATNDTTSSNKVEELESDLRRRQESYIRRQRDYEDQIRHLKEEILNLKSGKTDWMEKDEKMQKIKSLHSVLMKNVGTIQVNTAKVLQEQEKDLLRAFRARLYDVQTELEEEKKVSDNGASEWIEKNHQLERGLDWAKEMADRLERMNQSLTEDNTRLKSQYKIQEDDREFLIRQLVMVKKENVQLRQDVENSQVVQTQLAAEIEQLKSFKKQVMQQQSVAQSGSFLATKSSISLPIAGKGGSVYLDSQVIPAENETRYQEIIKRLKKLLDTERKNLQKVRNSYSADIQHRTELENLLRNTVEDVKIKIGQELRKPVSTSDFNELQRESVLEMLLSQERVASMLFKKTFPNAHVAATKSTPTIPKVEELTKPNIETIYAARLQQKLDNL